MSNRRKDVVWRTMAESIMHQPEPMVSNSLDFVEVIPLVSNLPVLDEELIDVLPMTIAPPLQNLRVGML